MKPVRWSRIRLAIMLAAFTGFLGSCKTMGKRESSLQFALKKQKSELLASIARTSSVDVCVAMMDGFWTGTDKSHYEAVIREAIVGWNDILVEFAEPEWPATDLAVKIRFVEKDCGTSQVTFMQWKNQAAWNEKFGSGKPSHAQPRRNLVLMDPNDYFGTTTYQNYVVRHEYGHLLGVGDTYRKSGVREPVGQPRSLYNKSRDWTDDDRAAIRASWRYVATGQLSCGPGYVVGKSSVNEQDLLFCVPQG